MFQSVCPVPDFCDHSVISSNKSSLDCEEKKMLLNLILPNFTLLNDLFIYLYSQNVTVMCIGVRLPRDDAERQ